MSDVTPLHTRFCTACADRWLRYDAEAPADPDDVPCEMLPGSYHIRPVTTPPKAA